MTKEDPPRGLLSKVAKFVRHPATPWSQLDSPDPAVEDTSREAMKEMLARRKRNDFVRIREFELLRKLRNKEVVSGIDSNGRPTFFHSSLPSNTGERAQTLKKIDEIEAQMSMQWWKTKDGASTSAPVLGAVPPVAPGAPRFDPYETTVTQVRDTKKKDAIDAPAAPLLPVAGPAAPSWPAPPVIAAPAPPTLVMPAVASVPKAPPPPVAAPRAAAPVVAMPVRAEGLVAPATAIASPFAVPRGMPGGGYEQGTSGFSLSNLFAVEVSEVVHDPELEEAAIRFANSDDRAAEASLLEAVGPNGPRHGHVDTWLALFDFYRATGQHAPFESAALDFAKLFGRSAPHWFSLPDLVERMAAAAADALAAEEPPKGRPADWVSPPVLDAAAVRRLTASVPPAGTTRLDWTAFHTIEPEAAPALVQLVTQWCQRPLHFELIAPDRLSERLIDATPSGRGDLDPVWWQLRMEVCRLMHRGSDFELAALDYCVTYEVSPPSWEDVVSTCSTVENAGPSGFDTTRYGESQFGAESVLRRPELLVLEAPETGSSARAMRLIGDMAGDPAAALEKLDAHWAGEQTLVIDCGRLLRVDFGAAGALLNWASAHHAAERQLHFIEVHRLLAPLFGVIGINEHGTLAVRRD